MSSAAVMISALRVKHHRVLHIFIISYRYLYNYKQSYLSALFEESVQFLNRLSESYTGEESDQGLELDFNPKGLQAVILIPLILLRKVRLVSLLQHCKAQISFHYFLFEIQGCFICVKLVNLGHLQWQAVVGILQQYLTNNIQVCTTDRAMIGAISKQFSP